MRRVILILSALLLALGLTLGLAGRRAAALTDAPGASPRLIDTGFPGDAAGPVSCWAAGDCIVVEIGHGASSGSILLTDHGTVAGRAPVPNPRPGETTSINDASCPTATICFVSGMVMSNTTSYAVGFIAPVLDGKLGRLLTFGQMDEVDAVSCSADGDCLAVGSQSGSSVATSPGYLISLAGGVVERITDLGAIQPLAISCSGRSCLAVGENAGGAHGDRVMITDGVPGKLVSMGSLQPQLVACASASSCLVAGLVDDAQTKGSAQEDLVTVHAGHAGTARKLSFGIVQLACTTASTCFGTAGEPGPVKDSTRGGTVEITRGVPGPAHLVPGLSLLVDLGCAGGACLADGASTRGNRGVIYAF